MKKLVFVFMFLFLASGVLSMDDPIRIMADPGSRVTLNVRLLDGGFSINSIEGIADEEGFFETTFFSLNREDIVYHVRVFSGLQLLREEKFENWGIKDPLLINCLPAKCIISIDERTDEEIQSVAEIVENKSLENESVVEIVENGSIKNESVVEVSENESAEGFFAGMAVFVKESSTIKIVYSVGAKVVLLLLLVGAVFFVVRRSKKVKGKEIDVDDEEKELEEVERKVKETADKIKKAKEKKEREKRISDAKARLAREEKELKELEEEEGKDKKAEED